MAEFNVCMGKGATGKKAARENRAKVYKYYSQVNPNGTITEGSEALNMHRHTVTKHCHALLEEKANGADLEALYGEPVTVQSVQATRPPKPVTPPVTQLKPEVPTPSAIGHSEKPEPTEDIRDENASGFYSLTLSSEGIRNIPWDEPYIKERFEGMSGLEFEGVRGDVMDFIKNGGYCLKDAVDAIYNERKARRVIK